VILLRKSLKSVLNQTKLQLLKKIKVATQKDEADPKSERKKDEVVAIKRLKIPEICLSLGMHPDKLHKTLTNPLSVEKDRVIARLLLSPLIQKKLTEMKAKYGMEDVESFLINNDKKIQRNLAKRLLEQPANESGASGNKKKANKTTAQENSEPEPDERKAQKGKKKNGQSSDKVSPQKTDLDESPKKTRKRNPPKEAPKSVDAFFMSSSGENYLASVTNTTSSASEDEDGDAADAREFANKKKKQSAKAKPSASAAVQKSSTTTTQRNSVPTKRDTKQSTTASLPPPILKPSTTTAQAAEKDLHPSWKAKSQMKKATQVQEFKGTKIKFNDGDE